MKENSDGNDTNVGSIGNSIEEEIETLEELRTHGYAMLLMKYEDRIKTNRKIDQALEHIVSDYKKVLKENEILKEEKEQAWGEWNNLEQGSYETEQKLKQQIKELRKENEELKNDYENLNNSVVVKNYYIKNSITVQKVKDKIEHYQKLQHNYIEKYDEINEGLQAMISALQELLESEE